MPSEDIELEVPVRIADGAERHLLRKQRKITLMGEIAEGLAEFFIQDIEILSYQNKEPVDIIISSCGGDVFAGATIIQAMRRAQSDGIRITGNVHGHAQSMAFFILQCCDERKMGKYCSLMCHGATTFAVGDLKNMEAEQKIMKKFQRDFSQLIANRNTSKLQEYHEPGYWFAILEENTPQYYDAEEALEMGLIDGVK